jgi:hypothetical protein
MVDNMDNQQQTQTPSSEMVLPPPVPWYQKFARTPHLKRNVALSVGIVVLAITGYIIIRAVRERQGVPTRAGTNTVAISIQPGSVVMPPDTTFQVWETADNPVAFTTVKIVFDPTLVHLIGEISTSLSPLTRVVKRTAASEANTTGIINLSLALDPSKRASPPTGTFQLATIPLSPNTTAQNISATLHLDTPAMQVVNPNTTLFTITTADSTITLTAAPPTSIPTPTSPPMATPTPMPTDIPTPTPMPTDIPTPTPIPTATATPIPTATATPVPTATATPVPTATATPVPTATATPVPTATLTPTLVPQQQIAYITPTQTPQQQIVYVNNTPYPRQEVVYVNNTPYPRQEVAAGCNKSCTLNTDCASGLVCIGGTCRNPSCTAQTNCTCVIAQAQPTPKIPVSGSGLSILGASIIGGGLLILLLGLAL